MANALNVTQVASGNATPVILVSNPTDAMPVIEVARGPSLLVTPVAFGNAMSVFIVNAASLTSLWVAAVIANGGTVSAGRTTLVQNFIAAEMAAGTWEPTMDYWFLWGENLPQALTSLKQRIFATIPSTVPTFTVDRGFVFVATSYINTGFNPRDYYPDTNSARLGVYERAEIFNNTIMFGASGGGLINVAGRRNGTSTSGGTLTSAAVSYPGLTSSLALTVISRVETVSRLYQRGVYIGPDVPAVPAGAVVSQPMYMGGNNAAGTFANGRTNGSLGAAVVGQVLTDAGELAQYSNIQAFATAVGAQV